jgi:hypothetical protein
MDKNPRKVKMAAGLSLRLLHANTFAQLKKLRKLTLSKLGSQLSIINSTAFNSSSLEELAFSVAVGYHFTENNTHPRYSRSGNISPRLSGMQCIFIFWRMSVFNLSSG